MKHIYILLLAVISFNCQKEMSSENNSSLEPIITTAATTSITNTSALSGGKITDNGVEILARGVCWAVNANPVATGNHTTDSTGSGIFTSNITGLTPNTSYHVRAYATYSTGTAYGGDSVFTTTTSTTALPTVTTSSISAILPTAATCGGNVPADGGAAVTARGVCWSTSVNPVATGNHTADGAGAGIFTSSITGLTAGTIYHVRAYATNSVGTAYGGDSVFTATAATIGLPTLTTTIITAINTTDATGGGNITADGGAPVTARGVCWSITTNPVATGSHTTNGTGTGTFISAVTGLTRNTTYYVRAYATNSNGTSYGNEIVITTPEYDVYVGGSAYSPGVGTRLVAKIWKNGVATLLTNGTNDAYIYSLFVINSDVYAGGIEHNGTHWVGKVWKNGVAATLTDGTQNGNVQSVFVSGSDVYVAGSDGYVAKVWKNGVVSTLSGGTSANSVYVTGSDVYVCGDDWNGNQSYAVSWKNGTFTDLTDRSNLSNANSIFVTGPDVYVGGRFAVNARLWKNTIGVNLSTVTNFNMVVATTVNSSGVYAAGYQLISPGGIGTAKYWKNGVTTNLTDGTYDAKVKSMFVFGTDVFVCGSENNIIKIWKNSIPTIINVQPENFGAVYLY